MAWWLLALWACDSEALTGLGAPGAGCNEASPERCFQEGAAELGQLRPNPAAARAKFSTACKVHHAPACLELGRLVHDGKGGPRDPQRAQDLLDIACKGELQDACTALGMMHYIGEAGAPRPARAVELWDAACRAEPPFPLACAQLGQAWEEGKGVEKANPDVARTLLQKACGSSDAMSCVALGTFEARQGKGHEADAAAALQQACTLDARFGCFEYAEHLRDGSLGPADVGQAAVFFQKTCSVDNTRGCFEAAELLRSQGLARKAEIESLYNVACEHGVTEACAKRTLRGD